MAEVGSASFRARAEFRSLITAAKKVAAALRDVEDARRDASGDVEIGLDAKGLRSQVREEVARATRGVEAEIPVEADTDPFQRGLRAGLAMAERARVDVPVDADDDEFRRTMRSIAIEGRSGRWKVYVPIEMDGDEAVREARSIVELAEAGAGTVDVAMDVDGDGFIGEVRRAVSTAQATAGTVDIDLDADGDGLRREVTVWTKIAEVGQKIRVPVEADTKPAQKSLKGLAAAINPAKLARALLPLLAFPAIVTGVQLLIGALGALGAAVVGVASQVGPLIGLLATLPSLALAIGGAFAAVKLAFSGVGAALKAYGTQQAQAGKNAAQAAQQERAAAKARAAAARQVEDAQRRLGDAVRRAAEMREAAARRVEDAERAVEEAVKDSARQQAQAARQVQSAERALAASHRNVQRAQEALNDARRQAIEDLEDLRRGTSRNALDEERALLSIEEARANLAETLSDPNSTDLDRRRALLDLRDAELDLADVRDRRADDAERLADLERRGVEGTEQVIDAKQGLADAEQSVLDAQQDLADSQQELTDAMLEGPRRIAEAQRELADAQAGYAQTQIDAAQLVSDAQRDLADAYQAVADAALDAMLDGASGADAFAEAMAKLPPSAQDFVRFLIGLKPLLDQLKRTAADNLFPGLTDGIRNVVTMMPLADRLVGLFARTVGDAAREVSTLALDPGFRADLEATGVAGANALGSILGAAKPLLRMLTRLGAAAAPLTEWLGKYVARLAEAADAQVALWRESGGLARFFDETRFAVENLLGGLGNLLRGLINIGRVAYEVMGKQWTQNLRNAGDRFREWTESVEGQNKIRKYFEDVKPAIEEMGRLLKDLAGIFLRFSVNPELDDLIRKIRVEFLPVLERLLTTGSAEFGAGIIDFFVALTGFLSAVGGSGVFGTFLRLMEEFLRILTWAADNVPGAKQLLSTLIIMAALSKGVSFVAWITGLKSIVGLASAKNAAGVSRFSQALQFLGITGSKTAAGTSAAATGMSTLGATATTAGLPLIGYIAIIAAVVAALALLAYVVYTNWDTIKTFTAKALDGIDDLLSKVPFYDTAKRVLGRVVDAFRGAGRESRDAWDEALSGVGDAQGRGAERNTEIVDSFDRQAQELLDGYERTRDRLQKDLDLGLITQEQYDSGIAALEAYLTQRQEELRKARENELAESQKQTDQEVSEAERRRQKLTESIRRRDPGFFQRRLEGEGGFDPGMWEENRRAQREAELAQEGFVGGLQILVNRVGYFMQDMVRGITNAMSQIPEILGKTGAEIWQKVTNVWTIVKLQTLMAWEEVKNTVSTVWQVIYDTVTGAIDRVRIWIAVKLAEIRTLWDSVWDATVGTARRTWDSIWLTVSLAIERVRAWIAARLQQIQAVWSSAWEWVRSTAENIWNRIRMGIAAAIDGVQSWIGTRLDWIKSKWDGIWNGIANGLGSVWDRITGAVRGGANNVIGILNGMIRGFNGILSRLPGGFQIPEISARFRTGGEVSPMSAAGAVPGAGRTDHVPGLLMPGEFVNRERVVRREGVSKFRQLNEGRATIVSLDEYRRQREMKMRRGGAVPGKPMRRGGIVGGVIDWVQDRVGGATATVIESLWRATKASANTALANMPGQDQLTGKVARAGGSEILSAVEVKVTQLLNQLRQQEASQAQAAAAQRAAQAGAAARAGAARVAERARQAAAQARVARSTPVVSQPIQQGAGNGFVDAMRRQFPQAQLNRVGPTTISILGGPTQDIIRWIQQNQQALRVSRLTNSGAYSLRAEVYHKGGGVGFDPSKEVLALLQRGEGVMAKDAVGAAQLALSPNGAVGNPVGSGVHQTVVNIEIHNPVGEPAEESIHRSLQRVAAHGLIPPIEEAS